MTSTVLDSKNSFCALNALEADLLGRSKVGPNTIARLCRDILFSASCWFTLELQNMKMYLINIANHRLFSPD